ncbi:MAG: hypothetical protein P1U56_05325 [Saprospiraceae bacterium]|nr:hypothetical protein [Saprospiraceae bacterium]
MQNKERFLRYSIALIFLIFGGLKFFPQLSPAEIIGSETVMKLTGNMLPKSICITALALFEVSIGLLLLSRKYIRVAIPLAIAHLVLTFTPFIFFPSEVFNLSANSLSLLGQYILKNIIIICSLYLIYPSKQKYTTVLS